MKENRTQALAYGPVDVIDQLIHTTLPVVVVAPFFTFLLHPKQAHVFLLLLLLTNTPYTHKERETLE